MIIGNFQSADDGFAGQIRTLLIDVMVAIVPAQPVERIEIPGPREMDVVYQYRVLEGWQGEIPLSLTYLVATRSYSQSVVVYQSQDWNKSRFWLA